MHNTIIYILSYSSVFHRVNHSKNAIVKPQAKHPDTAQREMEEAMKKVMEAQQLIDTAIEPAAGRDNLTINVGWNFLCLIFLKLQKLTMRCVYLSFCSIL